MQEEKNEEPERGNMNQEVHWNKEKLKKQWALYRHPCLGTEKSWRRGREYKKNHCGPST